MNKKDSLAEEIKLILDNDKNKNENSGNVVRHRLVEVLKIVLPEFPGIIVEIGAYKGETTIRFLKLFDREVIVVDPWEPGTQDCKGHEFKIFRNRILPYMDRVKIIKASSQLSEISMFLSMQEIAFAFVDGLHTYDACYYDITENVPSAGIIAVDDIHRKCLEQAFYDGATKLGRKAVHNGETREGYIV